MLKEGQLWKLLGHKNLGGSPTASGTICMVVKVCRHRVCLLAEEKVVFVHKSFFDPPAFFQLIEEGKGQSC